MESNLLHFANPVWFFGGGLIPIFWVLYILFYHAYHSDKELDQFIDPYLLPHLLIGHKSGTRLYWKSLLLWSVLWGFLITALAGPRWDYTEIDAFTSDQNLVVLLDLSESMNAQDVKPSRLSRAQQEIEDILAQAKNVNIGLVAFAADPHMINPLTDDREAIRHLLPSLKTELVYVQGSKLTPALTMASRMLDAEPGDNKSILIISDGGFEDNASALKKVKTILDQGIVTQTIGVGTSEGVPIPNGRNGYIKQNGTAVISKLETAHLEALSRAGKGQYILANYTDQDSRIILDQLAVKADSEVKTKQKTRYWAEHFYLFIFPLMIMILPWFRRGFIFPVLLMCFLLPTGRAQAGGFENYFKNNQQIAKQALEKNDFTTAIEQFEDSYRQGVAQYKAGNFTEAEKLFSQSSRPEMAENAAYNLGNAFAKQQKLQEAVDTYEGLLEEYPNNEKAKHNLEIVKKLLGQQQNQQQQQQNQEKNQEKEDQKDQDQDAQNEQQNDQTDQEKNSSDQQEEQSSSSGFPEEQNASKKEQEQKKEVQDSQFEQEEKMENSEREDVEPNSSEQNSREQSEQEKENSETAKAQKSQQDIDADQWLNRITSDPQSFLRNQFYIESKQNGIQEGSSPW